MQKSGGIGKGNETNSGFSAGGTTHRFFGNALGLKLQSASAALEDRAGRFDVPLAAIVAENSVMADADQSWREDMQTEAPDELLEAKGQLFL